MFTTYVMCKDRSCCPFRSPSNPVPLEKPLLIIWVYCHTTPTFLGGFLCRLHQLLSKHVSSHRRRGPWSPGHALLLDQFPRQFRGLFISFSHFEVWNDRKNEQQKVLETWKRKSISLCIWTKITDRRILSCTFEVRLRLVNVVHS